MMAVAKSGAVESSDAVSLLINQQVMPASSNGWLWQLLHAHSCWVAWQLITAWAQVSNINNVHFPVRLDVPQRYLYFSVSAR
jgi:hypothetical protein